MIFAIIGLVLMGFILGFSCRKTRDPYEWHDGWNPMPAKVMDLEYKVLKLEQENKRLDFLVSSMDRNKRCFQEQYMAHCYRCNKNFYAQTPDEQKVADMLKTITLTSEEIAKKLDIKIA